MTAARVDDRDEGRWKLPPSPPLGLLTSLLFAGIQLSDDDITAHRHRGPCHGFIIVVIFVIIDIFVCCLSSEGVN